MKILICDDHKIVRDGLRQILQELPGENSIDEAGDGEEVNRALRKGKYDIVILDISLPGKSGLEVLQIIKENWPLTNVLMLSMYPQEHYAMRALKLGASGYLTKDTASDELLIAIRKIKERGKYISSELAENIAFHLDKKNDLMKHELLSNREFEVLTKLAIGDSLMEIGDKLFISEKTVSTYRTRIMKKMNFSKNAELTKYCIENKII